MATRNAHDPDQQLRALSRAVEVLGSHAHDLTVSAAGSIYQRFVAQETKADALALQTLLRERCPHPIEEVSCLDPAESDGQRPRCELCGHTWGQGEPVIVRGEATDDDEHRCRALLDGALDKRCALLPGHDSGHAFPPPPLASGDNGAAPESLAVLEGCSARNEQGAGCLYLANHVERGIDNHHFPIGGDEPDWDTIRGNQEAPDGAAPSVSGDGEIDPQEIPF